MTGARPALVHAASGPLGRATLSAFALPSAAIGLSFFLVNIYFMKYATDVLGVAAGTMGSIFAASRIWDAVSDPLAGYLSDRTQTRLGRRRPWMLAAALPAAAAYLMLWNPPAGLVGVERTLWVGGALLAIYTTLTAFVVPHDALGAELTSSYTDRTRVFGWSRGFFGIGAMGAIGAVALLSGASADSARASAAWISVATAVLVASAFLYSGTRLRERPDYRDRGGRKPFRAVADVWRNPHARLLLVVFFLQQSGVAALTMVFPYFADYVMGDVTYTAPILAAFLLAGTLSVPVWIRLAQRIEKKTLLLVCMCLMGITLGAMFFMGEGDFALIAALATFAGFLSGATDTLFPSVQADVIDYDEYRTGERKEGTYFAVWAFSAKTASGVAGIAVGFLLQASGYEPNAEQTESAALAIRALFAGIPFLLYAAGVVLFVPFGLDSRAHAEIQSALERHARARSEPQA